MSERPWDDARIAEEFQAAFPVLLVDILDHCKAEYTLTETALQRIETMLKYNLQGGKNFRGTFTVATVRDLHEMRLQTPSKEIMQQAIVLGWCSEILQASALMADDIMDDGVTRRGKPCWWQLPKVRMDAVNDVILLEHFSYYLLRKHITTPHMYTAAINLYHEITLKTSVGQMLDLMAQNRAPETDDPRPFSTFTPNAYEKIVCLKTSYYSFYLPVMLAYVLCEARTDTSVDAVTKLAVEVGRKFQIQDDYLDCFGDPEVMGKKGSDIRDHKCTWLVVQALPRVSPAQLECLQSSYGHSDEESIAKVKQLYEELDLPALYLKQEEDSLHQIEALIEECAESVPKNVFLGLVRKIHLRVK